MKLSKKCFCVLFIESALHFFFFLQSVLFGNYVLISVFQCLKREKIFKQIIKHSPYLQILEYKKKQ